ncbi:MAG: ATP-binding protein, partial [Gammaproteobacteria bacterium]|nr:ATP-binding protein [Gammaproteobacteria bacterium]
MLNTPQHDFRTTELDPGLLSTPFEVQTNWHVIAGAQSCGKTTLVDQLADQGLQTVPEGARLYLEREVARGRMINEIRENVAAMQHGILDIQLRIEGELRATDVAFLDRAVPDCLAWWRVYGLNPNEILTECFRHRYASVFVLDRLPIQRDDLRPEDEALAAFLDEWIARDYSALGYRVVRVPVLSPEERLAFV